MSGRVWDPPLRRMTKTVSRLRRGRSQTGPPGFAPGALAEKSQAQVWNRVGCNFCTPRARWPGLNGEKALRFCAPERFCLPQGVTPVMGSGADSPCQGEMSRSDRGDRVGDYEHEVLIWSRPRRRFGDFAAVGKVTRRPQAAKPPCKKRNCSIIAPSSGPFGGHLPQRGKAFLRVPSSGPFGAAFAQGEGLGGRPHGAAPAAETGLLERNRETASSLFSRFSISSFCARLNVRFCFSATRKAGPSHA